MLKAILFDFDGVIVDSREATIEYFQETLRHFNLPEPHKEQFAKLKIEYDCKQLSRLY